MTNKLKNIQNIIFISLMITLMFITRGHSNWTSSLIHLPDFTIPALFIAGIYFRSTTTALILILTAVIIDNYAIIHQGVSANCITPAYSILLVAYYLVFLSGKFINSLAINNITSFIRVFSFVVLVTNLEWLVATASYYAFTSSSWANFPSYIYQWASLEILPTLEWMIVVSIIFSINYRFNFISLPNKNHA